ncbi:MAG TPA: PilZ domain-containing protein [Myxococcales bacterium]|jgi:hypothetical protein|nr:PilZ domain-containing protein [Myxococcales bacterium]
MEHGRQPRVSARIAVGLKIGEQINMRLTRDISMSGLFVELEQPLPLGESVELYLALPDGGEMMRLEGSVARSAADGVGIYFQGVTQEQRKALESFLQYLQTHGAPPAPPSPPWPDRPVTPQEIRIPTPGLGKIQIPDEYNPKKIGEALEQEQKVREHRKMMAAQLHETARAALKNGGGARAAELLREAIELSPGVADFHHDLGTAYYQLGEVDRAVVEFERALALQQGGD